MVKLHIGCGDRKLEGFINIDIGGTPDLKLDVRDGLPFPDESVDFVFSEHFIEHITRDEGIMFLKEVYRILKPGGVCRVATPDLSESVKAYINNSWRDYEWIHRFHYQWIPNRCVAHNISLREWEHQHLYDLEDLVMIGRLAGFLIWQKSSVGKSDYEELNNLEHREDSLVVEFVKETPQHSHLLPLVSICIPAYNPRFFRQTLQSALSQTYLNIEVVICDDSKADEIEKIAQSFSDTRIRFFKNPKNIGSRDNYFNLISKAQGKYIKYLNDDDLLDSSCVKSMVCYLEAYGQQISLVTSKRNRIDEYGNLLPDEPSTASICERDSYFVGIELGNILLTKLINFIGEPTTVMFRKEDFNGFDVFLKHLYRPIKQGIFDVALWLWLLSKGDAIYITKPLSYFRQHSEQEQKNIGILFFLVISWFYLTKVSREIGFLKENGYYFFALLNLKNLLIWWLDRANFSQEEKNKFIEAIREVDYEINTFRSKGVQPVLPQIYVFPVIRDSRALKPIPSSEKQLNTIQELFNKGFVEEPKRLLQALKKLSYQDIEKQDGFLSLHKEKVSIIIPVFNKLELTRKCVEAIQRTTPEGLYELIIVDNGSTDGTKEFLGWLGTNFKDVKVLINEKNLGFARACNLGAEAASTDYLLFLNNDTEPKPGWLESLLKVILNDETVAAVGSKLLFPDGTIQHAGVVVIEDHKLPDLLCGRHIFYHYPSDYPEANILRIFQVLTAACLLVRKSVFFDVNGFDEGYWNGYEDLDFCFKLQLKGWKLVYQPESVVIHYESQSGEERFAKLSENISRLHSKWLGKIKPDFVIDENGIVKFISEKIQVYKLPENRTISSSSYADQNLVSIVILTFNQLEYTIKCFESIKRNTTEPYEIIFVDNASNDGTVEWLQKQAKENNNVRLILNRENFGFAKGCNQGIKEARGIYIVLLNNDVIVTKEWLTGLLKCLKSSPDVGIVGPMTNYIYGPQQVDVNYKNEEEIEDFAATFRRKFYGRRIPMRRIVGFCMLFKKSLVEKIGYLDENFGIGHYEDDDFCLRAELAGFKNYIAGDVFIHHFGNRSFIGNKIDTKPLVEINSKKFNDKWSSIANNPQSEFYNALLSLQLIERAENFYFEEKFQNSLQDLLMAIKLGSNTQRVLENYTNKLIELQQYETCIDVLLNHMNSNIDSSLSIKMAQCEFFIGNINKAELIANELIKKDDTKLQSEALNLKGIICLKKKDFDEARNYFVKSKQIDSGFYSPFVNLGIISLAKGQKYEALEYFEKAFQLSPTSLDSYILYYLSIVHLGLYERAEELFEEALKYYPNHKQLLSLYINLLIKSNHFEKAIDLICSFLAKFGIPNQDFLNLAIEVRNQIDKNEPSIIENPQISLIMVTKNDEILLAKSLNPLRNFLDEIVIVDLGSTDRTKLIGKIFGAKIFDFNDYDDLQSARNFGISKSTGKWILILEPFEVISPVESIIIKHLSLLNGRSVFKFQIRNYTPEKISNAEKVNWKPNSGEFAEEKGIGWCPSTNIRLIPNDKGLMNNYLEDSLFEDSLRKNGYSIVPCPVTIHNYKLLINQKNTNYIEPLDQPFFFNLEIILGLKSSLYGINFKEIFQKLSYPSQTSASTEQTTTQQPIDKSNIFTRKSPLLSVILTSQHLTKKVSPSLNSLNKQDLKDFEIIMLDYNLEELKSLPQELKAKMITVANPDKNINRAQQRNLGSKHCKGKFIAFLDEGDTFYPEHLSTLVQYLETNNHSFVFSKFKLVGQSSTVKFNEDTESELDRTKLLYENLIPASSVCFRKEILEQIGYFDENLELFEDWDFWLRLLKTQDIYQIPKITCEIGSFELRTSLKDKAWIYEQIRKVLSKHKDLFLEFIENAIDEGNLQQAEELALYMQEFFAPQSNPESLIDLAVIRTLQGRLADAKELLTNVLNNHPQNEIALENLKVIEQLEGSS